MRTGMVYAQSWAFVHMLIFGQHDIPRTAIPRYVEAVSNGMPPAEAFRRFFGRTYAEMDLQLRAYLGDGAYHFERMPLAGGEKLSVQRATVLEVENALGRLAIVGQRTAQAMTHAGAAMAAAPDDPRGHELLALALKSSGDEAGASVEFETAVALGSKEFLPNFEVALAAHRALREAKRPPTPGEARRIATEYLQAISLYARHLASFENLARLVGLAEPLGEGDRKALETGRRLFPESAVIELGLAQLSLREGDAAGARAILERLLAARPEMSREDVEFARRLLAELEGRRAGRATGKR
jgi:Tfp pilus assembly protein PilF